MAAEGKVIGKSGLLHEGPNENQQSTTKLVEKPSSAKINTTLIGKYMRRYRYNMER